MGLEFSQRFHRDLVPLFISLRNDKDPRHVYDMRRQFVVWICKLFYYSTISWCSTLCERVQNPFFNRKILTTLHYQSPVIATLYSCILLASSDIKKISNFRFFFVFSSLFSLHFTFGLFFSCVLICFSMIFSRVTDFNTFIDIFRRIYVSLAHFHHPYSAQQHVSTYQLHIYKSWEK